MDNASQNKREHCIDCTIDPICKVTDFVSEDLIFVAYDPELRCTMVRHYGNGYYCTCKGRMQHYIKFGK